MHNTDNDLDKLARRAAGLKLGWLIHATVFALVNASLWCSASARACKAADPSHTGRKTP